MNLAESIQMGVKTLLSHRLRSSLTMLGMIIGNASVIAMVGLGQAAKDLAQEEFEQLGPNVLFVVPGNRDTQNTTFDVPKTLVWADAKAIAEQVPTVKSVAPQLQNQQVLTYRNKNLQTLVVGTTPAFTEVRSFDVDKGRFITDFDIRRSDRVVVLGVDISDRLFGNVDPIGKRMRIKGVSFQVVGVMEPKGSFLGTNQDDRVFVPLTTMESQITGKTSPYGLRLSWISVSAKDRESIPAAKFQMTNLLRLRHQIVGKDDFTIDTQRDILQIVGNITNALTLVLAAIASISLVVGGIGIMNIMLVSVSERTSEIGLRKAIGASQGDLLLQFTIEAVILSITGGFIGTLLGVAGIFTISIATPLTASISPVAIVIATSVSGGVGLFFGVFPARQAAKLDPIVALRRE
ncbi:ABC transporter permease [Geitlerinema sp. PCC 9228]|jgi:putative ABC transport system permease protein|uniref:ABC transporter permease n=1 Tax=Geitlerinema sp. PCC 9228 TaxID=111611 RepID=UPI0008F9DC97|nr:ABC transporter permease [Geitlerinema sp. PCC 9228]